jgi:hypothetical protein
MSSTSAARRGADDHRRPKVPAVHEGASDGRDEQVREGRGQEDQGRREGRVGDADEHGQGDLVQPVAEQADRLSSQKATNLASDARRT